MVQSHECKKEGIIATIQANIESLKKQDEKDDKWKERIEAKVDKILWFLLGQTSTVIVAIIVYLVNNKGV